MNCARSFPGRCLTAFLASSASCGLSELPGLGTLCGASDGFRLKVADAEDALDLLEVVGFVGEVNFSAV